MKIPTKTATSGRITASVLLGLLTSSSNLFSQASIIQIPGLGGSVTEVRALNGAGMVAGFAYTPANDDQHAFLFSGGVLYDLGGFLSLGSGLNAVGQVSGDSITTDTFDNHAFLFTTSGYTDLGTLGGSLSTATGINDSGNVVGTSYLSGDAGPAAFLYRNGSMTNLGTLGGSFSSAAGINASGQIVGDSATSNNVVHGFLFSAGVMTDLGTLGGPSSSARTLNNAGQVAGDSDTTNLQNHAFFYNAGVMHDIGTLGGTYSEAHAINNSGQVIGDAATPSGAMHGFLYSGGVLTDLGTFGGQWSSAAAINNVGQIVGNATDGNEQSRPFLWNNGTKTDVNAFLPTNSGWVLQTADFINDAGQIAGTGLLNGTFRWFLLSPVSNHAPVANAGPGQTVLCPAMAVLDASGSNDPDGDALTYQWRENDTLLAGTVQASIALGLGSHTIVLTVSDGHGGTSQATVVVTVVDTTAPTVTCPASFTVSADANGQGTVPSFLAAVTATDNCTAGAQILKTQSPPAGTLVGTGFHLITVTATDSAGNSSACNTSLIVADTTAPVILSVTANPNVLSPANGSFVPVTVSVAASDNCGATPVARLVSVTSNEPTTGPGDKTSQDWVITGDLTVNLRAERSPKGNGRTYTLTVVCTDPAGNSSSGVTTVFVPRK